MAAIGKYDGSSLQTVTNTELVKRVRTLIPFVSRYMVSTDKFESRIEWGEKKAEDSTVTLGAQHTSGSGTVELAADSFNNPYVINANRTQLATQDGSVVFNVTTLSSGTTWNVTVAKGSDSTLASGTKLTILNADVEIDADAPSTADSVKYSTWYLNYPTVRDVLLQEADVAAFRDMPDIGLYENTIAHHLPEVINKAMRGLEHDFFWGILAAGSGGQTRNSNTHSAGTGSSAGGLNHFNVNANGLQVTHPANTPFLHSALKDDIASLEAQGAFNVLGERSKKTISGTPIVELACNVATFNAISDEYEFVRDKYEPMDGTVGYAEADFIRARNVLVQPVITDAVGDGTYFLIPPSCNIEMKLYKLFDEVVDKDGKTIQKTGANTKKYYQIAHTMCVKGAYTTLKRTGITIS